MAKQISAINRDTVHRICSGQVVLNLATAVKELIENSLDAGATSIEVRLKEYGSELIEVSDNGKGIRPEDFKALALKHHTSKIRDFGDLVDVETFGFRGEALSSLCAVSEMVVTTKYVHEVCGSKLKFDHRGILCDQQTFARQTGTTVTLSNLFASLPVRQKEFHRNLKKEFTKAVQLISAYCLISINVKITCVNQTKKSGKTTFLTTQENKTIRDNVSCIFGTKQLNNVLEIAETFIDDEVVEEYGLKNVDTETFKLKGLISSCEHGCGRGSTDRQFYYINARPCEPTKVMKLTNEIYHRYNANQYPFVLLNILVPKESVDVNVTPDKRLIFLENEKLLLACIKSTLIKIFENIPSTYRMNVPDSIQLSKSSSSSAELKASSPNSSIDSKKWKHISDKCDRQLTLLQFSQKRSLSQHSVGNESCSKYIKLDRLVEQSEIQGNEICENDEHLNQSGHEEEQGINDEKCVDNVRCIREENQYSQETCTSDENKSVTSEEPIINFENSPENTSRKCLHRLIKTSPVKQNLLSRIASLMDRGKRSQNSKNTDSSFENEQDVKTLHCLPDSNQSIKSKHELSIDPSVLLKNSNQVDLLSNIDKTESIIHCDNANSLSKKKENESYPEPNVSEINIGKNELFQDVDSCAIPETIDDTPEQFSELKTQKGVLTTNIESIRNSIKVKRKKKDILEPISNRFHVEIDPTKNQNAEDELKKEISKSMFKEMKIVGQFNLGFIITRLKDDLFIVDQHATDEKYNFETLQKTTTIKNQKLIIPQDLNLTATNECILIDNLEILRKNGFEFSINQSAEATKKVKLVSIPVSQNWHFGKDDIEELLFMLQDAPNTVCRPSRIRAMFASRACRKSVMIGTALGLNDMRRLINNMGTIEQPWNCPHGRPTMRHLVNLSLLQ